MDGSTPQGARQGIIDHFQKHKEVFLFFLSIKSGGQGLNLTAANKVKPFAIVVIVGTSIMGHRYMCH
jgi:DNA repair and recombination protein RAD54B